MERLSKILNQTQVKSMLIFMYNSDTLLHKSQHFLIELANHILEYSDSLDNIHKE